MNFILVTKGVTSIPSLICGSLKRMLLQVMEKTEHAHLWLEVMTISGVEALFGLMTSAKPLQQTVLLAIKNLAVHPKMALVLLEYGLDCVTQLAACKVKCLLILFFFSKLFSPTLKYVTFVSLFVALKISYLFLCIYAGHFLLNPALFNRL